MGELGHVPREEQAAPSEPTWKSAPEWKFWLGYLEQMAQRSSEPPEIRSFSHVPIGIRMRDEDAVRRTYEKAMAYSARQRERREAGMFTEKQLADREIQFSQGPTGHLLERVLTDLLERYNLLGGVTMKASRFDDFFNGVDAVMEWPQDENGTYPRLAIDFSSASKSGAISHKRTRTKDGAYVRYFRSHFERDGKRGMERELRGLPAVVIRVSREEFKQLARDAAGSSLDAVLPTHPVRRSILRQVEDQLVDQGVLAIEYLDRVNPDDKGITELIIRLRDGESRSSVVDELYSYSGDMLDGLTENSEDTDRIQDILDVLAMTRRASIQP